MEVDVSRALELRTQLKELWSDEAPTITDLVVRAATLALASHPRLNATLEQDALTEHEAINIGLAVDADDGLIVPVIRDAQTLNLRELAQRVSLRLSKRSYAKKDRYQPHGRLD